MVLLRRKKRSRRLGRIPEARGLVVFCGLVLTLLVAAAVFSPPRLLEFLSLRIYDHLLAVAPESAQGPEPVLIGIDDSSLKAYGQWPWPRYRMAQLVDRLNQAGAKVIALDMLMPEEDRTSPEILAHERQRDLGELSAEDLFSTVDSSSNDVRLAKALSRAATVMSFKFDFDPDESAQAPTSAPLDGVIESRAPGSHPGWSHPSGALNSLPSLVNASGAAGFTNVSADSDGVLRRVPLLMRFQDKVYPSLAFAALHLARGDDALRIEIESQEAILVWSGRRIPLDARGRLLLAYDADKHFEFHSAATVLAGDLPAGSLAGRVVFVGSWASGLGDRHMTPFKRSTPGLEVHAVVASNLLNGPLLQQPPWSRGAELFFVLVVGILSTLLVARFGFVADLSLLFAGTAVPLVGSMLLLNQSGIYISPAMPLLLLLANCSLLGLVRYGIEVRKVYFRTRDLVSAQNATILGMVSLSAVRDEETGEHIQRTQHYVRTLAMYLRDKGRYGAVLSDEDVELLFMSAPLHDIGKVGIPDRILHKPGKLTEDEYEVMKTHPLIGQKTLSRAEQATGAEHAGGYLSYAQEVAISHHEKWDGSGYPLGLAGEDIPLAGRLMALADVYDALISKRVYKPAFSHDKARNMIVEMRGGHFDPEIVDAFLAEEQAFLEIASRFREDVDQ